MNFRQMLADRQVLVNSVLCVGLDPMPKNIPDRYKTGDEATRAFFWMKDVVDETAIFASMFKPNRAFWEALEGDGIGAMRMLIQYIRQQYPDIPVFLDCKRGDIAKTQGRYGVAHFARDGIHGMNFNPYMGKSTFEPLVTPQTRDCGFVGLCYTSNPDAREMQDVVLEDGRCYWEHVLERVYAWASELGVLSTTGLVMAAAHKDYVDETGQIITRHLEVGREVVGDLLWYLIPGVGTQGGFVEATIEASFRGPGSISVNASSSISNKENAGDSAGEAEKLRDQMRAAGGNC